MTKNLLVRIERCARATGQMSLIAKVHDCEVRQEVLAAAHYRDHHGGRVPQRETNALECRGSEMGDEVMVNSCDARGHAHSSCDHGTRGSVHVSQSMRHGTAGRADVQTKFGNQGSKG